MKVNKDGSYTDSIGKTYKTKTGRKLQSHCKRGHPYLEGRKKRSACKQCQSILYQEQREQRIHEVTARRLGITVQQVIQVRKTYKVCGICGRSYNDNGKALSVDHNHETGQLRELLCQKCNLALGGFQDSIEILKSAIKYLRKWKRK